MLYMVSSSAVQSDVVFNIISSNTLQCTRSANKVLSAINDAHELCISRLCTIKDCMHEVIGLLEYVYSS